MTRRLLIGLGLLFALTVLVRFPARWALALAPADWHCDQPAGSLWHGGCARVQMGEFALGPVSWSLHPLSLLLARIDLDLHSMDERAQGHARVQFRSRHFVRLLDIRAQVALDAGLMPLFPNDWDGSLLLGLDTLDIAEGRLERVHGTINATSLAQRSPSMPIGSYELRFDAPPQADGTISGALSDRGGPLAVSGTLQVRKGGQYELAGNVTTRPEASADLSKAVQFLGAADAQGRRSFSLAGNL